MTPEIRWRHDAFCVVLDTIISSVNCRFKQNVNIFKALSLFSPNQFPRISKRHSTAHDLKLDILPFSENYGIDADECASGLFSFASTFQKLKPNVIKFKEVYESEGDETDDPDIVDAGVLSNKPSFYDALRLLTHPQYHLVDAYPLFCQVYSIAVTIPISSCTAERSFSVLMCRVTITIHNAAGTLESLLFMGIEMKILISLDIEITIDIFGSSLELSRTLMFRKHFQ